MKLQKNLSAIILGAGTNGLGIARALAKEYVDVHIVDTSPYRLAMLSRYTKNHVFSYLSGPLFINELKALLSKFQSPPILFVTEEETLLSVSENRGLIKKLCHLLLPEHQLLCRLMSKNDIDLMVIEAGLNRPKTVQLKSLDDLCKIDSLRFPCILKPGNKNKKYGTRFKKGYKLKNIEELQYLAKEILPVLPDLVVQEWIEGGDQNIYFTLVFISEEGELITSFTGKKLRCWPLPVGGTASCAPAPEAHKELIQMTTSFFQRVGFVGLGGIEYKRDSITGNFYLIEPTVSRTDFQHEVAVLNGFNIPYSTYCYHTGGQYEPKPTKLQYAWIESTTERWSRQKTKIPNKEVYQGLIKVKAVFRWYDPAPWVYSIYRKAINRLKSYFHQ